MTRDEEFKDAVAGLNMARAMLVESSVNLERAQVAHRNALVDFDKYMNALAKLASSPTSTRPA